MKPEVCKLCGKIFDWGDTMASMACRNKATQPLCRACRHKVSTKILEERKLKKRKDN